jgi:DNA-directed RNA polymerase specialized sigma24 family protein
METDKEKRKAELLKILQDVDRKPQGSISDQEMITQCQSKDRKISRTSFNQLIQRYQNNVYTYVSHRLGNDQVTFEATRDVFVQAYKNISQVPTDTSVKAWLLKLAKRRILTISRKRDKWYVALVPMRIYQWYQQRMAMQKQPEAVSKTAKTECEEIRCLFSAYYDGELSKAEATCVETHLGSCEQCRLEYEKLQETIGIVHTFGLMSAPANLQRAINTVLDKETLWERCLNYCKKLAGIFQFPVPQIAFAAASIAIIFLGIAYYVQREQIRQMEAELQATRGVISLPPEVTVNTFVIFTGQIVSEEMPIEAGEYVSTIIPEPEKAEIRFIAGDITSIGEKIVEHICSIQGKIAEDQEFQNNTLTIRKITAELPKYSTSGISAFLQQLEAKQTELGKPSGITTLLIEIYIIDKTSF